MGIYYLLLIMSRFHSDPRVGAELFDAGIVFVTPVKVVGLFAVLAAMLLTPAHNAAPRRANLLPLFFVAFAALPIILTLALGVPTPSASISSLISYGLLLVATRLLVTTDERVLKVIRVMVMASALGSLWVFRQHFMQDLDRPGGIEQDPNYEALTLVMGIPLAIWLIRHELGKWWRREAVVSLVLMTFATLLTQSRGGLIALGVLGIAAVFYSRRKILTLTVLAAATAILVLLAPAGLNSRFQSIRISGMPSNGDESATRTRVELVVAGMNMIRSHPFLGIGLDNFKSVSNEYNPALAAAIDQNPKILQAFVVFAQARAPHPLHPKVHRPPLSKRLSPDQLVEKLCGPNCRVLTARRREIGDVEQPILCEVRIQQHVVQALCRHHLHARHSRDGGRNHAIRPHDSHGPRALCHQKIAVRKKRQRPRSAQPIGDGLDLKGRGSFCRRRRLGLSRKRRLGFVGHGRTGLRPGPRAGEHG